MVRLGLFFKRYRMIEDITQKDLAEQIGISASALHNIEAGKTPATEVFMKVQGFLFEMNE